MQVSNNISRFYEGMLVHHARINRVRVRPSNSLSIQTTIDAKITICIGRLTLLIGRIEMAICRSFYFLKNGFGSQSMQAVRSFESGLASWSESHKSDGEYLALRRIQKCFYRGDRKLDLHGLNLSSLPPQIGGLSNLKELDLSGNSLITLPGEIANLRKLLAINCAFNMFDQFPIALCEINSLERIDFNSNNCCFIPPEIEHLRSLKSIDLSNNFLIVLPPSMFALKSLEELDLNYNQISALPREIEGLTSLKSLTITHNTLTRLPLTFEKLTSLETLDLSDNPLEVFPGPILSLTKLVKLVLSNCKIRCIPPLIRQLQELQELNLANNAVISLPSLVTSNNTAPLSKLVRLNLDGAYCDVPDWALAIRNFEYGTLRIRYGRRKALLHEIKMKNKSRISLLVREISAKISTLIDLRYWFKRNGWSYNTYQKWCQFEAGLKGWENDPTAEGFKLGAVKKIRRAIRNDILDLNKNSLTSLPAVIGELNHLTVIGLGCNNLSDLPPSIGKLSELTYLDIGSNRFEVLPEIIFGLSKLKDLIAWNNELITVSPSIGNLVNLQELVLDTNKFVTLPATLGNLRQLRRLNLETSPLLEDLPLSLGNLPYLRVIAVDRDGPLVEKARAILERCFFALFNEKLQRVPQDIQAWKDYSKEGDNREFDLDFLFELQDEEKLNIIAWLERLSTASDYSAHQAQLAFKVCAMLETLRTNATFKEEFFAQVTSNLSDCGDRAAMAFNEIYTCWYMHTLPAETPFEEKINILARFARTVALRAALATLIVEHQKKNKRIEHESVEIYLYYETSLKEKLNLLTAIEGMSYRQLGKRDWINERVLVRTVENNYISFMAEHAMLVKLAESNELFKKIWEPISDDYAKKMEELSDKNLSSAELHRQSKDLINGRKNAFKNCLVDWITNLRNGSLGVSASSL